jgi:hypothetical protein
MEKEAQEAKEQVPKQYKDIYAESVFGVWPRNGMKISGCFDERCGCPSSG